jgi:hypothetical protein
MQEVIICFKLQLYSEDGNDGTMFPETIPLILLHASWFDYFSTIEPANQDRSIPVMKKFEV